MGTPWDLWLVTRLSGRSDEVPGKASEEGRGRVKHQVGRNSKFVYRDRRLSEGYPGLEALSLETFEETLARQPDDTWRVRMIMGYLDRLIDIRAARNVLLVGCGPRPETMRILREMGFNVLGVEPVWNFVVGARRHLNDEGAVLEGRAEELPNASESQDVVILESVLEHVDSVGRSLAEAHRVLAPGGVAYISTTNRLRLVPDAEFNVRFFPSLPNAVKESYVFRQLHYEPSLANYSDRPAVHWFTYAELCQLGREAGFFQFYSQLDLKIPEPWSFSGGDRTRRLKAKALMYVQNNSWLRALALSQRGGVIFMMKRT
jgi:ubiquinone/menaquinone biosynthesis C-methylase UbiE